MGHKFDLDFDWADVLHTGKTRLESHLENLFQMHKISLNMAVCVISRESDQSGYLFFAGECSETHSNDWVVFGTPSQIAHALIQKL